MARKTALVKVSGDLCTDSLFLEWLHQLSREYFVVVCVGGGTQINKAFEEVGLTAGTLGPLGRETRTFEERQLARDVLERNQAELQDLLAESNIPAVVVLPVLEIGSVLCHVNGDVFVLTAYNGFDRIFVVTLADRRQKKQEEFSKYPKIEVISFD